ncbi:PcfJ domain-containing protein [Vibrio sp. MMG022]|uniref:PcfJ domain-containing protein n=1 Tax=Vibrio sp. MMG023 TaxID=2909979 RepID=UPI0031BBC4BC|nr:PcfJ domain-containing protein [Vibrio sp. MMG023]
MNNATITLPTTMLGFNYDIELEHWQKNLHGYRVFSDGKKVLLDGGLGISLNLLFGDNQYETWLDGIPQHYLTASSAFAEYQYQMLWLAANCFEAAQLLEGRPILLALICAKYSVDNDAALELAKQGQREILAQLGLDSSKAVLKFIDKLALDFEYSSELKHVLKQLDANFSRFKVFSHYKAVTYSALLLDHSHPFLTGTNLGRSIAEQRQSVYRNMMAYMSDTLRLGNAIGINDPVRHVERLSSVEDLIELHDAWVARQIDLRFEAMKPERTEVPYPKCLADGYGISQIVDFEDLCAEAKEQLHCIAVYHNRIAAGHYAAFRMEYPERMTIGVSINPKKAYPYEVQQIAGYKNAVPSEETRSVVHEWFDACKQLNC